MTIANWTILGACMLPVVTMGLAKAASVRLPDRKARYDNNHPRDWEAKLTGWQARAYAAQNNGFEALPLFIAAVILAQQAHAEQGRIDLLALSFIGIRIAYVAAYLADIGTLRSLIWGAGLATNIALLAMA
ncbi:MAPEG family protein [Duganella sp. LX20W]|uniref:MAPEG family protein n=1 Tax=Rugamonas brunnea TaxID=2758569 RepID=A0A7W2ET55_9BURK|nr:MAPEG family protein [Rugamonas brunnea]MBA5638152.1 MAPEG family protein [Rugamonas brunnea]